MSNMPQITDAELEVMKVIWENAPISTNDIVSALSDSQWNVRTIQTLISRLEKKGVISHTKNGRVFVYTSLVNKDEYIRSQSKSFINKFFSGAANKMVMNFIENDMLTKEELEQLKKILDEKE